MYSPKLEQVHYIHERLIATSGGSPGVEDAGRLQAALAQPFATYDGEDLYPGVLPKAVALAYFLIQGHPFHDGNRRICHARHVEEERLPACGRGEREGCLESCTFCPDLEETLGRCSEDIFDSL